LRFRTLPIFLGFFVMGFVDAVGTLVGFAEKECTSSPSPVFPLKS
jgi:xanthine/uracil/vitamin C permease (AzgA family)